MVVEVVMRSGAFARQWRQVCGDRDNEGDGMKQGVVEMASNGW